MKFWFSTVTILLTTFAAAENSFPVVLVHGIAASGDSWDYRKEIEEAGLPVIALDLYKFTSAWERAAQIYAQLKGTVTDFGVCRSAEFGHNRFGPDYTGKGLYPEWDENHPIHLWGHSFGGPTIVLLETLLREGSNCAEDTSPLFTGNKTWIRSITTLSGVLGGTTAVDLLDKSGFLDIIKDFVVWVDGYLQHSIFKNLYIIDFDHWGVSRKIGETFGSYFNRVEASGIIDDNDSLAPYDLSVQGARENNALRSQMAYPETYYYAVANELTNRDDEVEQDPSFLMNPILWRTGDLIGESGHLEDRKNDGIVNWRNMHCPIVTDADRTQCLEFAGNWTPGTWFYQDVPTLDHLAMTGRNRIRDTFFYEKSALKVYVEHAARTKALP